jgi:hypothetical protein
MENEIGIETSLTLVDKTFLVKEEPEVARTLNTASAGKLHARIARQRRPARAHSNTRPTNAGTRRAVCVDVGFVARFLAQVVSQFEFAKSGARNRPVL